MLLLRLFAVSLLVVCSLAAHRDVLVRSDFHFDDEGWTFFGAGKIDLQQRGGVLYGSDKGRKVWYFRAPESFIGDKCFAYNGELAFRIGHSEYMSNGKDMIRDWDVILESKLWKLRFGAKNIVPPWVGASKHVISLHENAWININSNHPPTTIEMLRMLTAVSAIYIRGGFYDGHEETWIDEVQITEGDHKQDVLLRKIEKHATHPSTVKPEEPPPPPPHPDDHLDFEEKIAREQARKREEMARKEEERKEQEKRDAEERQREIEKREREEFERAASKEEKEIAKALEKEHLEKGEKEGDLTIEEIQYAVDSGEKELLRKMMQQQEEESRLQKERENLAATAHSRHLEQVHAAEEKEKSVHDVHVVQEYGAQHRDTSQMADLHRKAHDAAKKREEANAHSSSSSSSHHHHGEDGDNNSSKEKKEEESSSRRDFVASDAVPAQPLNAATAASSSGEEGDLTIDQVVQIAQEQEKQQQQVKIEENKKASVESGSSDDDVIRQKTASSPSSVDETAGEGEEKKTKKANATTTTSSSPTTTTSTTTATNTKNTTKISRNASSSSKSSPSSATKATPPAASAPPTVLASGDKPSVKA